MSLLDSLAVVGDFISAGKDKLDALRGTDLEKKVKEATSNENWGTSNTTLREIAKGTFDYDGYREIMPLIWQRLDERETCVKYGSERVIDETKERIYAIKTLMDFQHFDNETAKDCGTGIREKAKQLFELLNDNEKIREIRAESRKISAKADSYRGISNDSLTSYGSESKYGGGNGNKGRYDDDSDNDRNKKSSNSKFKGFDGANNNSENPASSSGDEGQSYSSSKNSKDKVKSSNKKKQVKDDFEDEWDSNKGNNDEWESNAPKKTSNSGGSGIKIKIKSMDNKKSNDNFSSNMKDKKKTIHEEDDGFEFDSAPVQKSSQKEKPKQQQLQQNRNDDDWGFAAVEPVKTTQASNDPFDFMSAPSQPVAQQQQQQNNFISNNQNYSQHQNMNHAYPLNNFQPQMGYNNQFGYQQPNNVQSNAGFRDPLADMLSGGAPQSRAANTAYAQQQKNKVQSNSGFSDFDDFQSAPATSKDKDVWDTSLVKLSGISTSQNAPKKQNSDPFADFGAPTKPAASFTTGAFNSNSFGGLDALSGLAPQQQHRPATNMSMQGGYGGYPMGGNRGMNQPTPQMQMGQMPYGYGGYPQQQMPYNNQMGMQKPYGF